MAFSLARGLSKTAPVFPSVLSVFWANLPFPKFLFFGSKNIFDF